MLSVKDTGSTARTEKFLNALSNKSDILGDLHKYGKMGVDALSRATPTESGLTARSWEYKITTANGRTSIEWYNTNTPNGFPVALMLQYGHGTGTGGWVSGYDYINPAMRPIFDKIADDIWKKVKNV